MCVSASALRARNTHPESENMEIIGQIDNSIDGIGDMVGRGGTVFDLPVVTQISQ